MSTNITLTATAEAHKSLVNQIKEKFGVKTKKAKAILANELNDLYWHHQYERDALKSYVQGQMDEVGEEWEELMTQHHPEFISLSPKQEAFLFTILTWVNNPTDRGAYPDWKGEAPQLPLVPLMGH